MNRIYNENTAALKKPFFSILMPVYNAEKFLHKSIGSITGQTFNDFELIIVNDCSTDKSLDICLGFADHDKRISVMSTVSNFGVANARNEAVGLSNGLYFNFVDADDYIDSDVLQKAHDMLLKTRAQILKYGCFEEYFDADNKLIGTKKLQLTDGNYTDRDTIRNMIIDMEKLPLFGYVWNTFYNTLFAKSHSLKFDTSLKVNEDFMFNMDVFDFVDNLACLNYCGYHYEKKVNNSLSTKVNPDYFALHTVKIVKMLEKYKQWQMLNNRIEQDIFWFYTRFVYSDISRILMSNDIARARNELQDIFSTPLFMRFKQQKHDNYSCKEKLMILCLQEQNVHVILILCRIFNFIKVKFKYIFALVKT